MAECEGICIAPDQVREFWPHVAPLIRRSVERADLGSFAAVEHGVLAGDYLLWLVHDGSRIFAAVLTALETTELRTVCNIVACGGSEMNRWLGLLPQIEAYAAAEGCAAVRIIGREGWQRVLPAYRKRRVVLERTL